MGNDDLDVTASAHGASLAAAGLGRDDELLFAVMSLLEALDDHLPVHYDDGRDAPIMARARKLTGDAYAAYCSRLQPAAAVERVSREDVSTNPSRAERHVVVPVELLSDLWRYGNLNRVDGVLYGKSHADRLKEADDILCKALSAAPPVQMEAVAWRDMGTAPKDSTMVRLLVDYSDEHDGDHPLEDSAELTATIGFCNDDNVPDDEAEGWKFAGWCWSHDHFVQGRGKVIGWAPYEGPLPGSASPVPSSERDNIIEMCAKVVDDMKTHFASHQYATNQPASSYLERIACSMIAGAIRSLKSQPAQEAE